VNIVKPSKIFEATFVIVFSVLKETSIQWHLGGPFSGCRCSVMNHELETCSHLCSWKWTSFNSENWVGKIVCHGNDMENAEWNYVFVVVDFVNKKTCCFSFLYNSSPPIFISCTSLFPPQEMIILFLALYIQTYTLVI